MGRFRGRPPPDGPRERSAAPAGDLPGVVGQLLPVESDRRDWHPILQELVRSSLALALTALLAVTVVWAFVNASDGDASWRHTKDLLQLLLPAETALLGSAVGFYFGTRKP